MYCLILLLFTLLMYLLRDQISFIRANHPDSSLYIIFLRVFSYLVILYFFYSLFIYYKEKNQLSKLDAEMKGERGVSDKGIKELFEAISRKDNSFMPLFMEYYPNFMPLLMEINPSLSTNEVEVCALLKLGLTTNEISIATSSSYKAIESARFRIRKKLSLNTKENLTAYFNSIGFTE